MIACDIVWAETGASFPKPKAAEAALQRLRVDFSHFDIKQLRTLDPSRD